MPFHELYATFAASHFFIAFDVAAMLTVSHIWWMAGNLGNTTWPIWMLVVCFLAAPFFYNPQVRGRARGRVRGRARGRVRIRASTS